MESAEYRCRQPTRKRQENRRIGRTTICGPTRPDGPQVVRLENREIVDQKSALTTYVAPLCPFNRRLLPPRRTPVSPIEPMKASDRVQPVWPEFWAASLWAEGPAVHSAQGIALGMRCAENNDGGPTGQPFIDLLAPWADTQFRWFSFPGRCPGLGERRSFGAVATSPRNLAAPRAARNPGENAKKACHTQAIRRGRVHSC
jgi:hypothetical protein